MREQIYIADNGIVQRGFEDPNDCRKFCKKKPGYKFKVIRFKPRTRTPLLKNALVKDEHERSTLLKLIYELCLDYEIETDDFLTDFGRRSAEFILIRSIVMKYSHRLFGFSNAEAGFIFNKHSATAYSNIKTLNNRIETDVKFKNYIEDKFKLIDEYHRNYNNTKLHTES